MIKYNNSNINDWYFNSSDIIKVYRHNAVCYYKVNYSGDTPTFDVCYAVVEDITQYSDTEFEDVYDKATEKWYKLNNLNQYEEYGVYGSGRTITTYDGKLTVDDGYEYEWNGSSWVNLGEVSGSSRVPIGYTEVEYIQNTGTSYINTNFKPNQDTRIVCTMQCVTSSQYGRYFGAGGYNTANAMQFDYENGAQGTLHISWGHIAGWTIYSSCVGDYNVHTYDWDKNYFYRDKGETNQFSASTTYTAFQCVTNLGIFCQINDNGTATSSQNEYMVGKMYSFQIYDNGTLVRDLVPCKRDNDSKYGVYDVVNNTFYPSANSTALSGGSETGSTEYPVYYAEKSDPLDNLTFSSMTEATNYAYNNCVYDGMKATIGTDRYYFDSEDENGWVKVTEYYVVEDVTPNAESGWTITGSSTYNPNSSYYDDYSVDNQVVSSSYKTHIAKVTIYGYENFTYYLRSNGYSIYSYVTSTNIDELQTNPTSMISYSSSNAITNTYNFNKSAGSTVNLSNYRRVTYNNLDKTVEHTFYVAFNGRNVSAAYGSNATILIPKEQTNENWEQVTFSASSNVASAQKSLYIDNNNSTSGGTSYWYYRWMIGLPSGSHTSYTNFSNYDNCPNVASSTFTSVAGEQRQVNFTYDGTSSKSLSFRLTDGSNVLTPSDTVYFNMTYYNSCGVSSSSSNVTFPRSQNVKVGGRFRFTNSSNRHYIYGYSPSISLNYDYYVDNYQSTFDITYTKLSEEAVTITYTTYDPNDVETPAFKTDITWPYSGGTTSSTTLTSYEVPYTYSYKVSQTSDKFSASTYEYTAGQAARTINFVLYPNNREFATVADLEAYAYAWEGMIAYVGTDKYVYQNGEWVYNPSRLPAGYTEVEYIQNTGTSYLNTNFVPNQDTRVICDMELVTVTNFPRLWGAGAWNSATGIMPNYEGGHLQMSWLGKTSWTTYTSVPTSTDRKVYDVNKNYLYVDNVEIGSNTYTTRTASDPIGVFTYIGSGRPSSSSYWGQEHFKGKMYSFKVYDNGTLVRDLVPCIRDNDNTVGAYDLVNDVFYTVPTGYTTDKLVAGNPV